MTSLLPRCLIMLVPLLLSMYSCKDDAKNSLPHIVYILADDLGYGDVSCFNPGCAWETPSIDRIAIEGVSFTDAHSGSAVCTPTRYGVLTGRYSWRTTLKEGVLWSWDPPLIGRDETTVAGLLREEGYHTACIGKWHLGLGWQFHDPERDSVDFSRPLTGGPLTAGFEHFFGITASLDIPPYVYVQDNRVTTVPTRYTEDTSRMGWWRKGLTGNDFVHEEVLQLLTEKAAGYIDERCRTRPDQPFFLYFPLTAPHTPIIPNGEFRGKSGTNLYGDFVLQVDHAVNQVLEALDRNGIAGKTLVIFTSDNGCSPSADFEELARFGHDPSAGYRGHKADIFEGGHRIPFMARWPGKIEPGTTRDQVICLTDLMATVAAITGHPLEEDEGVDSHDLLPLMEGKTGAPEKEATVHHSVNGSFAIRQGSWKLILCPGSGGWSNPKPGSPEEEGLPGVQLYNLKEDPGEERNLQSVNPDKVDELTRLLGKYILDGRSTPGPTQDYVKTEEWPGLDWFTGGKQPANLSTE